MAEATDMAEATGGAAVDTATLDVEAMVDAVLAAGTATVGAVVLAAGTADTANFHPVRKLVSRAPSAYLAEGAFRCRPELQQSAGL
jgi:hypothetical protein